MKALARTMARTTIPTAIPAMAEVPRPDDWLTTVTDVDGPGVPLVVEEPPELVSEALGGGIAMT